MTINQAFSHAREAFSSFPGREAQIATEWVLTELLQCNRAHLYAYPDRKLGEAKWKRFIEMIKRHQAGEPLQYITGNAYFYGLKFKVNPAVLIPRPETELLVDAAVEHLPEKRAIKVLEVGTGSGCIAISIAHERPSVHVDATDISTSALNVASENAANAGVNVAFVKHDMAKGCKGLPQSRYDLIVSNPPYIPEAERQEVSVRVRDHEPERALFTDEDAMMYFRYLDRIARRVLADSGLLIMEAHAPLAEQVADLFENGGWRDVELREDLTGKPRLVMVQRREG